MLTRKEIIKASVLAILVIGLVVGGELSTSAQSTHIKDLEKQVSGAAAPNAIAEAQNKKKQLKKLGIESAKWKVLLASAEKLFPQGPKQAVTNEDVAAAVSASTGTLVKCDKGTTSEISWNPPKPAEGEGGADGAEASSDDADAAKANAVKYVEDVMQLSLRGDYQSWLDFLVALEQLNKFYRFKELTMKASHGGKPDQSPLTIDLQLASYHVLEFPSDRKAEKKEE